MTIPSVQPVAKADPLMLNLWQSGRELFHSNTLAYLIARSPWRNVLLEQLTGYGGWHQYELRVLREKWNLDIVIIARMRRQGSAPEPCVGEIDEVRASFADWRAVVIENKFKSLPDCGQLMRYTAKLDQLFKQRPFSNEGCNGPRKAGLKLLCDLWSVDFPEKSDSDLDDKDIAGEECAILSATSEGGETPLSNRERVDGYLYRVLLQPTLANASATSCADKPCPGCAPGTTDCPAIDVGLKGATFVRRWRAVGYRDLMRCLPARCPPGAAPALTDQFIPAYRSLVVRTTSLHTRLRTHLNGPDPFSDVDALEVPGQRAGIWDFVDKWRYGWLAEQVKYKIIAKAGMSIFPAVTLQFKPNRTMLPDHPGRVGLFDNGSGFKCWILSSAGYSRGLGLATVNLVYCLNTSSNGFQPGKYSIALQLQGRFLKLMLSHAVALPSNWRRHFPPGSVPHQPWHTWVINANRRLMDLSSAVNLSVNWIGSAGGTALRSYGGGQQVDQLHQITSSSLPAYRLTYQPGSILYWSAEMWSPTPTNGKSRTGVWATSQMDQIAEDIVSAALSILCNVNFLSVPGNPNPDWF